MNIQRKEMEKLINQTRSILKHILNWITHFFLQKKKKQNIKSCRENIHQSLQPADIINSYQEFCNILKLQSVPVLVRNLSTNIPTNIYF